MDSKISNSKFLQYLFERAEAIKNENGCKILTANHFFAAVLRCCEISKESFESLSSEYDSEEVAEVYDIIDGILIADEIKESIELLCAKKDSYIDDLLFRQNVSESEKIAKKSGKNILTADSLLKSVILSPTEEIKTIIRVGKEKSEGTSTDKKSIEKLCDDSDATIQKNEESVFEEENCGDIFKQKRLITEITRKVKLLQKRLSNVVFGQDNAISIFASGFFQSELRAITDKSSKKPRATYLFAGPPGVGKTFLAEQAAELLGLPFMRFDMSEYAERDALMELCGTNESFKGAKKGALTGFVDNNPKCVLLFDEIEKANINVIHLFLQILDAGRLRDTNTSKEVNFSQTIIIFTTNAGRKIYEGSFSPNLSSVSRKTILKALENDVDPKTGLGSFPAAICSRFATGNVIMFNHMEAHSLRKIAENEIKRNAQCLENETGMSCNISDDVYSCVLFAEGGHADARTVKSRANSFFSTELYELFRLISNESNHYEIEQIKKIDITLDLPTDEQCLRLFRDDSKGCVLFFGDEKACNSLNAVISEKGYKNIVVSSLEEAEKVLEKQDVEMVLCDLHFGIDKRLTNELNIEDVISDGRTFFKNVCEKSDIPVYVISDKEHKYSEEELFSLTKEGARGVVDVSLEEEATKEITDIMTRIHQQQSMLDLAKSSKLVTYETSQMISDDGETAEIRLFDIALATTVDAEDGNSILNNVSKPNIKFSDIIGADSAKAELEYFVNYLMNPKSFASKGLGVPKGVLFYGPPGTGKTMLAKAVAGESNVTFICAEGNQFLKKYVGEGEETVHSLFATARKYAPTILFIDEIDAIAKERRGGENSTDSILTAFLAEMDGFKTDSKKPVFVLAATNFEVEPGTSKSLDPAFLRRFDRHIYIDLPDKKARLKYIKLKTHNSSIFNISEEEVENIAVRSIGMSLAQLASVFEFSMRIAIRKNKSLVDDEVFEEAFESYNYGEEKKWDVSELEKTAYHEAGHAFLCWYSGETPSYLTIVARGNHGGYMLHGDNENRGSYTKKMLLNRIRTALGGRAAELVFYGDEKGLTTGASSDLKTATAIAKSIVCDYGMDDEIGLAVVLENELSDGLLAQKIRKSINNILREELEEAKDILFANRIAIEKIVESLLQKNHLGAKDIEMIFSMYASKKC